MINVVTLSSGVPKGLYNNSTVAFARKTRSATSGDIRLKNRCANRAILKYRVIQSYSSVPVEDKDSSHSEDEAQEVEKNKQSH